MPRVTTPINGRRFWTLTHSRVSARMECLVNPPAGNFAKRSWRAAIARTRRSCIAHSWEEIRTPTRCSSERVCFPERRATSWATGKSITANFREKILARGDSEDSEDPSLLYRSFMGGDADPNALLERAGLLSR